MRKKASRNICYIMKFRVMTDTAGEATEPRDVYKVGITTRQIEMRLSEVAMSFFGAYRYIPMCKMIRFSGSEMFEQIEKDMHEKLQNHKYRMSEKISGYTEFFTGITDDELKTMYDELLEKYKDTKKPKPTVEDSSQIAKLIGVSSVSLSNIVQKKDLEYLVRVP